MWVYHYYYIFICCHGSWYTILAIVWVKDSKGSCANRERKWLRPSLYIRSPWCFCPTGRRNYSVQSHKGQQPRPSMPAAEAGDGFSSEPVIEDVRKTKRNRWEEEPGASRPPCFPWGSSSNSWWRKLPNLSLNSAQHSRTNISTLSGLVQRLPRCHFSDCRAGHYAWQDGILQFSCGLALSPLWHLW